MTGLFTHAWGPGGVVYAAMPAGAVTAETPTLLVVLFPIPSGWIARALAGRGGPAVTMADPKATSRILGSYRELADAIEGAEYFGRLWSMHGFALDLVPETTDEIATRIAGAHVLPPRPAAAPAPSATDRSPPPVVIDTAHPAQEPMCDGDPACTEPLAYECRCPRCAREQDPRERFHVCLKGEHLNRCLEKHREMRGRDFVA